MSKCHIVGNLMPWLISNVSYFSYVHIVVGGKVQKIPTGSPAGVSSNEFNNPYRDNPRPK